MARKIEVQIVGDAASLERAFARSSRAARGWSHDLERAGRGGVVASVGFRGLGRSVAFASGAFLGGAGLVTGMKSSIASASNLNEQISKTNVVFGDSASQVKAWAQTSSESLGLAEDQALATASSFGALFQPLKIVGDEAARQSERLSQLGADLASFYNTSVQDALDAIRSGIVGESEPLRRYGVLLSEVRVQQEALNRTGKLTVAQLTQQDKVLARISLILRDTSQAQGDFQRTSGGLANQTRILRANMRDLGTTIGQSVTPVLGGLAKGVNSVLGAVNALKKAGPIIDVTDEVRASLVPKLANDFRELKEQGLSSAEAMRKLRRDLGDTEQASLLVAEAIRFTFSQDTVSAIAALRQEIRGIKPDAEAAAKAIHGIAAAERAVAAAVRASAARQTPAQQRSVALAEFFGSGGQEEVAAINDQLAATNRAIAFAQKQISRGKGNARKFSEALERLFADRRALLDRLNSIAEQRKAELRARRNEFEAQVADIFAPFNLGVDELPLTIAEVNRAVTLNESRARQAAQFRALGLTSTGDELAPTRKALLAETRKITDGLKGTLLDTDANRNLLARVRKVLALQFGALTRETRLKVKELLDALNGDDRKGPLTAGRAVSTRKLTEGLGLSGDQRRELRQRIAGAGLVASGLSAGASVGSSVPLLAGATNITVNINGDGKEARQIARETIAALKKEKRRSAPQTRGRSGGHTLGLT